MFQIYPLPLNFLVLSPRVVVTPKFQGTSLRLLRRKADSRGQLYTRRNSATA